MCGCSQHAAKLGELLERNMERNLEHPDFKHLLENRDYFDKNRRQSHHRGGGHRGLAVNAAYDPASALSGLGG